MVGLAIPDREARAAVGHCRHGFALFVMALSSSQLCCSSRPGTDLKTSTDFLSRDCSRRLAGEYPVAFPCKHRGFDRPPEYPALEDAHILG